MANSRTPILLPVVLIVVVVVAAGVGAAFLYEFNHPKTTAAQRTVVEGDNVTVNYIGTFGSGPQLGHVFDTSLYSVASNNASYPKSLEYAHYGTPSSFSPLPVHVGPNAPSSGYSLDGLTFSSVITGFWQGLVGLSANHTARITIAPSLGYGAPVPSCFVSRPLVVTVPTVLHLTTAQFTADYPSENATVGTQFPDPTYGWNDLVLSANATGVVVQNLPPLGWSVPGTGWPVIVTAINSASITVTNQLTPAEAGTVAGVSTAQVCSSQPPSGKYIVSAVDPTNGTYTEDFNSEVVGATLVFQVTVVQFY